MACASAAVVAAASSGLQLCDASSRTSTSSVSLKAQALGHVRCSPRALSLNDSVKKVRGSDVALRVQHSVLLYNSISNVPLSSLPHLL
jgi:hypothetical protein